MDANAVGGVSRANVDGVKNGIPAGNLPGTWVTAQ